MCRYGSVFGEIMISAYCRFQRKRGRLPSDGLGANHQASEDLREEIAEAIGKQAQDAELLAQMEFTNKFQAGIRGKHHLLSTKVRPGIYNSPYAAVPGGSGVVRTPMIRVCHKGKALRLVRGCAFAHCQVCVCKIEFDAYERRLISGYALPSAESLFGRAPI